MSTATNFINLINVSYPVAGQDNDTQGFRDNYANIKNGLLALGTQVDNTLNLFTNQTNNFNGNIIDNANLQAVGEVIYTPNVANAGVQGPQTVDYTLGSYQQFILSSSTSFTFQNWPTVGNYGSIKLALAVANTQTSNVTATITGPVLLDTYANNQVTLPITLSTTSYVLYEVSSGDGGVTQFVRFVGGPFV